MLGSPTKKKEKKNDKLLKTFIFSLYIEIKLSIVASF